MFFLKAVYNQLDRTLSDKRQFISAVSCGKKLMAVVLEVVFICCSMVQCMAACCKMAYIKHNFSLDGWRCGK